MVAFNSQRSTIIAFRLHIAFAIIALRQQCHQACYESQPVDAFHGGSQSVMVLIATLVLEVFLRFAGVRCNVFILEVVATTDNTTRKSISSGEVFPKIIREAQSDFNRVLARQNTL